MLIMAHYRYPKWAHTFENQLSLDFRTKETDALLLYTDDGGVQGNFYALTIAGGRLQVDFRSARPTFVHKIPERTFMF